MISLDLNKVISLYMMDTDKVMKYILNTCYDLNQQGFGRCEFTLAKQGVNDPYCASYYKYNYLLVIAQLEALGFDIDNEHYNRHVVIKVNWDSNKKLYSKNMSVYLFNS